MISVVLGPKRTRMALWRIKVETLENIQTKRDVKSTDMIVDHTKFQPGDKANRTSLRRVHSCSVVYPAGTLTGQQSRSMNVIAKDHDAVPIVPRPRPI